MGRRDKYSSLEPNEKVDLALEEIDLLENQFDKALGTVTAAFAGLQDEVSALRGTLTKILITIVTGIVVAMLMWGWTNATATG